MNATTVKIFKNVKKTKAESDCIAIFSDVFNGKNYVEYYINFNLTEREGLEYTNDYLLFSEGVKRKHMGRIEEINEIDKVLLKEIIYKTIYKVINDGAVYIKKYLKGNEKEGYHRYINMQLKLALRKYKYS